MNPNNETGKTGALNKQLLPDFIQSDEFVKIYPSDKMTVFETERPSPVLKGEYSHPSFEFAIAKTPIDGFTIDGKNVELEEGTIAAINSDQIHGTRELVSNVSFFNIQFEKAFLQELSYGIYGTRNVSFHNEPVKCSDELYTLIDKYKKEYEEKNTGYTYNLSNLSIQTAIELFRLFKKDGLTEEVSGSDKYLTDKAIEHIKKTYEEKFSLEEVSKAASMNKYSFIRKFKAMTGKTPQEYFMDVRIMKAIEFLGNPSYKVIDVALQCGFKNPSHFSRIFKEKTGLTPKEYRKSIT